MQKTILPLALCLLAPAGFAQTVRPTSQVDNSGIVFDPVVASEGDLTVLAYAGDNDIYVQTSDGRGLTWSAPVRIDSDTTGARKDLEGGRPTIGIVGSNVYVIWNDRRSGGQEVWFAASNDGGQTFGPDQNLTPGSSVIVDWRLVATDVGGTDAVHVLYSEGSASQDLYLRTSTDGGNTFGTARFVPAGVTPGQVDTDDIDIAADGPNVYIAWEDNRLGGDTVFFQKSVDIGTTFLPADVNVSGGTGAEDSDAEIALSLGGSNIVIAWSEEPAGIANEVLRVNASSDLGASFNGPMTVGSYTVGTDDVDAPVCRAQAGANNIVVAWEDNRSGGDLIYSAYSTDVGLTWSTDSVVSGTGGFPRITGAGDVFVIGWTGGGFPEAAQAAISYDVGVTWQPQVNSSSTTGDADFAEGVYNPLYDNFIAAWLSDDLGANNLYAAGFRAATVVNDGWGTSNPTIDFDLSGFGGSAVAFLAISLGTGPLVIPMDGRDLGVTADGLFLGSFADPIYTAFLTGGAGSTPTLPNVFNNIPTIGITVNYVGFGVNGGNIGRISDRGSFDL